MQVNDSVEITGNSLGLPTAVRIGDRGFVTAVGHDSSTVSVNGMEITCVDADVRVIDAQQGLRANNIEKETREIVRQCSVSLKSITNRIAEDKRHINADINNLTRQLQDKIARQKELDTLYNSRIRTFSSRMNSPETMRYVQYLFQEKYERIQFDGYYIIATTKPVTMLFRNRQIDMGVYTIEINMMESVESIRVTNPKSYAGYVHPHISGGRCCFGTYADTVSTLSAHNQYFELLNLMHDYLSSCYPSGWYIPIYPWIPDIENCENCYYEYDDCRCERDEDRYYCDNCDTDITNDSCDCLRCPNTNDVLEGNAFPDSQCGRSGCLHKDLDNDEWRCGYDEYLTSDIDYYEPPSRRYHYHIEENNQTREVRDNAH